MVAIAAGSTHSLAATRDGAVVAWGSMWESVPEVPDLTDAVDVAAGSDGHSFALRADGTVVEFGGYGHTVPEGLRGVVDVQAVGWGGAVALKRDGTVQAWDGPMPEQGNLRRDWEASRRSRPAMATPTSCTSPVARCTPTQVGQAADGRGLADRGVGPVVLVLVQTGRQDLSVS